MEKFRRQETVPLRFTHYAAGALADADSAVVEVWGPDKQIVVNTATIAASTSTGLYDYNYTSASTVSLGKYHANCILTSGTVVVRPEIWFEIVEEVE